MENIITKTVLFDYFSGRVSPIQKKSVESWLADASNRQLYYEWLHEWERGHLQTAVDWEAAFVHTTRRMHGPSPAEATATDDQPLLWWQHLTLGTGRGWQLAASVILLLALSGWLFRDPLLYQTVRTDFGETRSQTLPDGSSVILNANSSLRYPRWFGNTWFAGWTTAVYANHQSPRLVELTGEADFSIRHLPNHQRFVVRTPKGLNVTVLGTQFTVFSRERNTRVVLRSGRVQLTMPQRSQPPLMMRPGDLVTLSQQGKLTLARTAHPEALAAWKNHRFTFEQTSLQEIANILHDDYGLTVTIKNAQLASRTVSGSFPAQNANEVLQLVAQLLQINYSREDNRVSFFD